MRDIILVGFSGALGALFRLIDNALPFKPFGEHISGFWRHPFGKNIGNGCLEVRL